MTSIKIPRGVQRLFLALKCPQTALKGLTSSKLYANKGYISKALANDLKIDGIVLVTGQRNNMKEKVLAAWDRAMFAKRFIIETINVHLENIILIEHSRYRSVHGFILNLLDGLIAYLFKTRKAITQVNKFKENGIQSDGLNLSQFT